MSIAGSMNDGLVAAINTRVQEYADALDHVLDTLDSDDVARPLARSLRETIELARVLRRVVPTLSVQQIHKAFGAPGDFGYGTPIGEALAKLYLGAASERSGGQL